MRQGKRKHMDSSAKNPEVFRLSLKWDSRCRHCLYDEVGKEENRMSNLITAGFTRRSGLCGLSPEQTVVMLRCFMNDEENWETARKTGITLSEAEQCRVELWNIFAARKAKHV